MGVLPDNFWGNLAETFAGRVDCWHSISATAIVPAHMIVLQNATLLVNGSASLLKVAFFQKMWCVFQISKSQKKYIPKNYPELEI